MNEIVTLNRVELDNVYEVGCDFTPNGAIYYALISIGRRRVVISSQQYNSIRIDTEIAKRDRLMKELHKTNETINYYKGLNE